jgi:hypothetical protein
MQTFLPHALFSSCAKVLDTKRLGKQRVEVFQMLKALKIGPESIRGDKIRKTPWYNHPCTQMWKGYEKCLVVYGLFICQEWISRGYKDSLFNKIHSYYPEYIFVGELPFSPLIIQREPTPSWLGDERLHASHRSNLLRKDPGWYSSFGWKETNDIPYFWPTKTID